ncbi:MAG: xanthine dehydrogenase family protein molybdopterin-binding subunit [Dehalococcoidia bacterium]
MTTTMPAGTPTQLVGQRVKRREDPRLIQGRATYVDDIKLTGMLHMAFKRSDVAHGRIVRIDTAAAEAMPGVTLVLTGAQLKEMMPPMPIGTPFPAPDHYPVTHDKVRFVGEPVAVVVARDRYVARDAIDAISVEIEELPAVVDVERAMSGQPALVHDGFANNLAVALVPSGTGVDAATGAVDDAAIDRAFAQAEVVISQRMTNQRLAPVPMEPRGVIAHYEPGKEYLTVWGSTQNPHIMKTLIAAVTGLGEHQVRVVAPEVGGGFGSKINVYGEDYVAAVVSRRLGHPVKWIEDRSESFMTATHGRDLLADVDLAAKRDGTVLGVRMRIVADIGAYEMLLTAAIPTLTQAMLNGVYDIPAVRSTITEVFTNKNPTDAYRGAGRPEGIYFLERAMDMLAHEIGMDPGALRRKNFIQPDRFPFTTQTGLTYDSGNYEPALDKALQASGWQQLVAERDAARAEGRVVGLGLAFYVEICGLGPSAMLPSGGWEHASVTIERSGHITATTGASPHGQGNETTFAQMLADEFGVPMDDINILHGDTAIVRHGLGTYGSRSQAVGGAALMMASGKVKEKMSRFAAALLEAKAEDMVFENKMVSVRGVPGSGLPFADVAAYAYRPVPMPPDVPEPGLSDEAFFEPSNATFPFGCYISMVEVDRDTGEIAIRKFVGVDDCGTVVNPLIVRGQIHGGLAQGIGQALIEEVVYDEDGQLVTGSFMDYAIARASDFPRFELSHTETRSPVNPLGAKGIGEAGTIGSTPCIVNAVVDALSPFGVKHLDMMMRPEKVWRLMQGGAS